MHAAAGNDLVNFIYEFNGARVSFATSQPRDNDPYRISSAFVCSPSAIQQPHRYREPARNGIPRCASRAHPRLCVPAINNTLNILREFFSRHGPRPFFRLARRSFSLLSLVSHVIARNANSDRKALLVTLIGTEVVHATARTVFLIMPMVFSAVKRFSRHAKCFLLLSQLVRRSE